MYKKGFSLGKCWDWIRDKWSWLWFKFDKASAGRVRSQIFTLFLSALVIVIGLLCVLPFCKGVKFSELIFSTLSPARLISGMNQRI